MYEMFVFFVIIFAMTNVAISLIIMSHLNKRKISTNILLARLYIFKYLNQYRAVTLEETGRVGSLFYFWIISINLALISAIGLFFVA